MMHLPLAWIMDVQSYLDRLGAAAGGGPSPEHLLYLHERHLIAIPFENLDIHRGVEIALDEETILQKVIEKRRGGFCDELSAAFAWLLRNLGYDVTLLSAEVARRSSGFGIPFDHMTLGVKLEHTWLADVGFGDSFRFPIPLASEGEVEKLGDRFRLRQEGAWWILERLSRVDDAFRPQYRFTSEPRRLADFAPGCRYHQTSPQSSFSRGAICTRALPDGRVTLHPERLVTTRMGMRTEEPIGNREEWEQVLDTRFGIVVPPRSPAEATRP